MLVIKRIGRNGRMELSANNTIKLVSKWKNEIKWSYDMRGTSIIYICQFCEAPFIEGQMYTIRDSHSFHNDCRREWYAVLTSRQSAAVRRARRRLDFVIENAMD